MLNKHNGTVDGNEYQGDYFKFFYVLSAQNVYTQLSFNQKEIKYVWTLARLNDLIKGINFRKTL